MIDYGTKEEVIERKMVFGIKHFLTRGVDYSAGVVNEKYAREYFGSLLGLINETKGNKQYQEVVDKYLEFILKYEFQMFGNMQKNMSTNSQILLNEYSNIFKNTVKIK